MVVYLFFFVLFNLVWNVHLNISGAWQSIGRTNNNRAHRKYLIEVKIAQKPGKVIHHHRVRLKYLKSKSKRTCCCYKGIIKCNSIREFEKSMKYGRAAAERFRLFPTSRYFLIKIESRQQIHKSSRRHMEARQAKTFWN